jgi:hypothetical protein
MYSLIVFTVTMFTLYVRKRVSTAGMLQQRKVGSALNKPKYHTILRQPIHTRTHI